MTLLFLKPKLYKNTANLNETPFKTKTPPIYSWLRPCSSPVSRED